MLGEPRMRLVQSERIDQFVSLVNKLGLEASSLKCGALNGRFRRLVALARGWVNHSR